MFEICLIICALVLFLVHSYKKKTDGTSTLPPGSMGLPFIGETLGFARQKIQFFRSKHEKYGKVFKTHLFGKPTIRVYGSDNLRKILSNEAKYVESCYPTSVRKLLGEDSISMSQGDLHVTKKQQLMKYLCPAFFQHHVPVFSSIIADRIQTWATLDVIDLHRESRKLFIELAVRFLIKFDIGTIELEAIREQLDIFTDNIFCLPLNFPGFGFRKALNAKKELRRIFQTYLKEQSLDNNNEGELCSVLEDFRSQYNEETDDVRKNELFLDSVIELLFAGAETVSSAGFSLAYQLTNSQHCVSKLREELRKHELADFNQTVCLNDLKAMNYLDAVIHETLRTIPPIGGFFRTVKEEFQLEGYTVPAGWCLAFSIRDTQHSDRFVSDGIKSDSVCDSTSTHCLDNAPSSPEFNPDIWLSEDSIPDKYSFLPFGSGLRKCPGQAYAKIVLKLFVIELTRSRDAHIVQDSPLEFWPTPRPVDKVLVSFKDTYRNTTNH